MRMIRIASVLAYLCAASRHGPCRQLTRNGQLMGIAPMALGIGVRCCACVRMLCLPQSAGPDRDWVAVGHAGPAAQ